ncbi:MAG: DUF4446 family protein [Actinobacteria bacterium]|nr:DUF4446 family protein [Actinomycetota bacterium]
MIQNNVTIFIIVLLGVLVINVALTVYLYLRIRTLESESELLARDTEGHNIIELVNDSMLQVERMNREVNTLTDKNDWIVKRLAGALRNVGMVRFDAFRDLGGLMSFAVALLDDRGNGMVISSIYGRSESRTYAKPVVERSSKYELSPEEREAIRLASQNKELGALPEEALDRDHRERIENLRLFHDKDVSDYLREEHPAPEKGSQPPKAREQATAQRSAPRSHRARSSRSVKDDDRSARVQRNTIYDRESEDGNAAKREPSVARHRARPRRPDSPTDRSRDRDTERR